MSIRQPVLGHVGPMITEAIYPFMFPLFPVITVRWRQQTTFVEIQTSAAFFSAMPYIPYVPTASKNLQSAHVLHTSLACPPSIICLHNCPHTVPSFFPRNSDWPAFPIHLQRSDNSQLSPIYMQLFPMEKAVRDSCSFNLCSELL